MFPTFPFYVLHTPTRGSRGREERFQHVETVVDERIHKLSVWVVFPFIEWNIVDGSYMIRHVAAVRPRRPCMVRGDVLIVLCGEEDLEITDIDIAYNSNA